MSLSEQNFKTRHMLSHHSYNGHIPPCYVGIHDTSGFGSSSVVMPLADMTVEDQLSCCIRLLATVDRVSENLRVYLDVNITLRNSSSDRLLPCAY